MYDIVINEAVKSNFRTKAHFMNKLEIIQRVACTNATSGSVLVEHETGIEGVRFALILQQETGTMQVMIAQILASQFEADTAIFPEKPTAEFFARLHVSALKFFEREARRPFFYDRPREPHNNYHRLISRLKETAREHDITYEPPDDSVLK